MGAQTDVDAAVERVGSLTDPIKATSARGDEQENTGAGGTTPIAGMLDSSPAVAVGKVTAAWVMNGNSSHEEYRVSKNCGAKSIEGMAHNLS